MNQIPSFTGAMPAVAPVPAVAQLRFSLDGVPERERRGQVRDFLGRELTKYDVEPAWRRPASRLGTGYAPRHYGQRGG